MNKLRTPKRKNTKANDRKEGDATDDDDDDGRWTGARGQGGRTG